jgi:quinol monooxygenase YgiN
MLNALFASIWLRPLFTRYYVKTFSGSSSGFGILLQRLPADGCSASQSIQSINTEEMVMINVIASIYVKTGTLRAYLEILKATVPAVRREKGCVEYIPMVDIDAILPTQVVDHNVVTILEKWEGLEALHAHLASPHMLDYREKVKNIVVSVTVKVLQKVNSITALGEEHS